MPLYARGIPRFLQFVPFPAPATRYPSSVPRPYSLPNHSLLRKIVQRQSAQPIIRRPVAAERVDVAAQRAVALVLGEIEVVDRRSCRRCSGSSRPRIASAATVSALADSVEVAGGLRELQGGEMRFLGGCVASGARVGVRAILSACAASTCALRLPHCTIGIWTLTPYCWRCARSWYASSNTDARWLNPTVADTRGAESVVQLCFGDAALGLDCLQLRVRACDSDCLSACSTASAVSTSVSGTSVGGAMSIGALGGRLKQALERRVRAVEVELRAVERRSAPAAARARSAAGRSRRSFRPRTVPCSD